MNKTTVKVLHTYGKGNGCTNNGISETVDRLTIAWGVKTLEEAGRSADVDLVLCDGTNGADIPIRDEDHIRSVLGRKGGYVKAVVVDITDGVVGPMNGGNYAMDNNGMSILKFPVPIHDRFETQREYNLLSL